MSLSSSSASDFDSDVDEIEFSSRLINAYPFLEVGKELQKLRQSVHDLLDSRTLPNSSKKDIEASNIELSNLESEIFTIKSIYENQLQVQLREISRFTFRLIINFIIIITANYPYVDLRTNVSCGKLLPITFSTRCKKIIYVLKTHFLHCPLIVQVQVILMMHNYRMLLLNTI